MLLAVKEERHSMQSTRLSERHCTAKFKCHLKLFCEVKKRLEPLLWDECLSSVHEIKQALQVLLVCVKQHQHWTTAGWWWPVQCTVWPRTPLDIILKTTIFHLTRSKASLRTSLQAQRTSLWAANTAPLLHRISTSSRLPRNCWKEALRLDSKSFQRRENLSSAAITLWKLFYLFAISRKNSTRSVKLRTEENIPSAVLFSCISLVHFTFKAWMFDLFVRKRVIIEWREGEWHNLRLSALLYVRAEWYCVNKAFTLSCAGSPQNLSFPHSKASTPSSTTCPAHSVPVTFSNLVNKKFLP